MDIINRFLLVLFALCVSSEISIAEEPASQEQKHPQNNAKALFEASLGFLKEKIKESGYILTDADIQSIKRSKNTFSIPKKLRVKGIASIPILQEDVVIKKIKYTPPDNAHKQLSPTQSGFIFTSVKTQSVISKLGIRSGDILYKVNDEVVDSTDRATRIFNTLKESNKIEVQLVRKNELVTYQYLFI